MECFQLNRRQIILAMPSLLATHAFSPACAASSHPVLRFLVVGDWGRDGSDHQVEVAEGMGNAAAQVKADFVVSTGDNFYNHGVSSISDKRWDSSFESIYRHPAILGIPWFPVLGNHDYGGNVFAQIEYSQHSDRWYMPYRYYKIGGTQFGRADIDLFFIDTVLWTGKESFPYNFLGTSTDEVSQLGQFRWLERELERSSATFKLVFGHHPIYSVGNNGRKKKLKSLDDLLVRHNVTAYICGHDHCLYHVYKQNSNYICSGAGSRIYQKFTAGQIPSCVLPTTCGDVASDLQTVPRLGKYLPVPGFAMFEIDDYVARFRFISAHGDTLFEHAILGKSEARVAVQDWGR